jgi:hypothetical protein
VSSKRGEIFGKKGIRTLFTTVTGYNPDLAKTEEQVEKVKEKAAKLKGEVSSRFVCCLCKQTGSCGKHRYRVPKYDELDCLSKASASFDSQDAR